MESEAIYDPDTSSTFKADWGSFLQVPHKLKQNYLSFSFTLVGIAYKYG